MPEVVAVAVRRQHCCACCVSCPSHPCRSSVERQQGESEEVSSRAARNCLSLCVEKEVQSTMGVSFAYAELYPPKAPIQKRRKLLYTAKSAAEGRGGTGKHRGTHIILYRYMAAMLHDLHAWMHACMHACIALCELCVIERAVARQAHEMM